MTKDVASTSPTESMALGIYRDLANHQGCELWFARDAAVVLQLWADRMNVTFKLHIPEIAIRIDALRRSCYGHFRYGHNGFGLRGEVAINALYMNQREPWKILGTLLHELLHAWQQAHGTPGKGNYHNREFRQKAKSYGLLIDRDGVTTYVDGLFSELLLRHGVDVPPLDIQSSVEKRKPGNSKLKKWSCNCTNVRCATQLKAVCVHCNLPFRLAETHS